MRSKHCHPRRIDEGADALAWTHERLLEGSGVSRRGAIIRERSKLLTWMLRCGAAMHRPHVAFVDPHESGRPIGADPALWIRCTVRENAAVSLDRLAWLITVLACLVTSALLLLSGYLGYAGVLLAVAASAAVNLRP